MIGLLCVVFWFSVCVGVVYCCRVVSCALLFALI